MSVGFFFSDFREMGGKTHNSLNLNRMVESILES